MKLRKVNINYKVDGWVTTCNTCGSEYDFNMKDTILSNGEKYVQCPNCGDWHKVSVTPHKYNPLNTNILNMDNLKI